MAGIEGDYEYIEKNIETLTKGYMEILNKIKEVLLHFGVISVEKEEGERLKNKSQLDDRMVVHMLQNIEEHLDNFDFAKVFSILEEIKKYQVPQKYKEVLQQVEELMEDLSIDKIKNLLKEIEV